MGAGINGVNIGMDVNVNESSTTTSSGTTNNSENVNMQMGIDINGVNVGMNVNINDGSTTSSSTTTTTTTTTSTTSSSGLGNSHIEQVQEPDCYTMSSSDYQSALKSIESKSFADSKLILAKQVAKSNCSTAGQIKSIMQLFTFEDNKLEYAKFAYGFCFNPENYWKLNDAFEFESTIEELNDYIDSL